MLDKRRDSGFERVGIQVGPVPEEKSVKTFTKLVKAEIGFQLVP